MKFDKDGKFLESSESSFKLKDFVLLPNNQYLVSLGLSMDENSNGKVVLTSDFKTSEKSFLNFHKDFKDNKLNLVTFHPFGDKVAYMYPIDDTLYIFNNKGLIEQAIIFPDFDGIFHTIH